MKIERKEKMEFDKLAIGVVFELPNTEVCIKLSHTDLGDYNSFCVSNNSRMLICCTEMVIPYPKAKLVLEEEVE